MTVEMGQPLAYRPDRPGRPAACRRAAVPRRNRRRPRRRLGQTVLFGVFGSLAALVTSFHVLLLWRRLADQTLLEPLVATRWVLAVLLVAAFFQLRRARVSMLWGRRALILWLAVLVLHFGALSPEAVRPVAVIAPVTAAGVLVAVSALLAAAILPAFLRRFGAVEPRRRGAPRPPFLSCFEIPSRLALQAGYSPSLVLRPPPA